MSNINNNSNTYRYKLERGSKKHNCPNCDKKTFVAYIDIETGEPLPKEYGRCDRENKCAYKLNPYLNEYAKMIWEQEQNVTGVTNVTLPEQKYFISQSKPEPVFFDFGTFKQTLLSERYENNMFIQNLFHMVKFPFEVDDVTKVIQLYRLGTVANGYRAGATTFPFIDINDNVRAIQVKEFDEQNHTTGTDFLHSIIEKHHSRKNEPLPAWLEAYTKQDKRVSCLFGGHLLNKYPNNPVALVEAPKTAIYSTLYFGLPETPESLIWLAVYNKSSFSFDKLKVLQGRFVYVFPDLSKDGNTFKEWETKAKNYESRLPKTRFIFSDLLERLAPENDKIEGSDLADYLIKQDWRLFREQREKPIYKEPESVTNVTNVIPEQNILFLDDEPFDVFVSEQFDPFTEEQPQDWNADILNLENYFESIEIPSDQIKLGFGTVRDCSAFVQSHFDTVKANNGNNVYLPYLNRLQEFKDRLTNSILASA
ncbi:DUF6965 family protein [Maribacter sp. ACAM166]|uniref:DUF6965 family protein n=1 Tax=Maribacter sp. ACAM166 TaxID=2508996 RepID=UPI001BB1684E|nr:DUF6371 domain-containing protein [Maribacter sp. ACAM166]